VGNIPAETTKVQLVQALAPFTIQSAYVKFQPGSTFAFIYFPSHQAAEEALLELKGQKSEFLFKRG